MLTTRSGCSTSRAEDVQTPTRHGKQPLVTLADAGNDDEAKGSAQTNSQFRFSSQGEFTATTLGQTN
jgi:hypothetical protein